MQLESSSDLAVQSKVQFHPLKDQVKNLEEQIQCLKFDNEQLRLHVNDFITTEMIYQIPLREESVDTLQIKLQLDNQINNRCQIHELYFLVPERIMFCE